MEDVGTFVTLFFGTPVKQGKRRGLTPEKQKQKRFHRAGGAGGTQSFGEL